MKSSELPTLVIFAKGIQIALPIFFAVAGTLDQILFCLPNRMG